MITKRFELITKSGRIAFGRTMSYTDESRTGDALSWFLELASAHNIDTSKNLRLEITNR